MVFTADVLDPATLARVSELNIPVNAGSGDMLDQLSQVSAGHHLWLRINPGFDRGHSQKTNTGSEIVSTAFGMRIFRKQWEKFNTIT